MAENDDENLLGFDPLAWMHEQSEPEHAATDSECSQTADNLAGVSEGANHGNLADAQSHIMLEATNSIQDVQSLHEALLNAFNQSDNIDIDASAVQQIDTATMQLLLIAKQSAVKLQKTLSIDFPSERFIEAANLLGLAEMLEVDSAASGFF